MGSERYNAAVEFVDTQVDDGRGGKVAFRDRTRQLTYGQLADRVARVGPAFRQLGVRREERVLLLLLDTIDFPVVFWGAIRAGIVPIPLNTLLGADQYRYILEDSRAGVVIVSEPLLPVLREALGDKAGAVTIVVAGETEAPAGTSLLSALLDATAPAEAAADTYADDVAFWLYSSGSTGMPKGVKHVHSSPAATARAFGQGVLEIRPGDVVFSAAKLFFAYGLGNSLTFPMFVGATSILLDERPTPQSVFATMKREQPTIFFGVPTLYAAILADESCTREAWSQRLRLCVSAGEALPEHIGRAWEERFGVEIVDGLGSTEMLHIFVSNTPGAVRYGTSGVPVPGYEAKLLDEDGAEVGAGEIGELVVSGPSAAEGYWNQREKSRHTFEGRWTRTGDKYIRDADGYYTYCGRTDDMFKVSGIWVSPFEVESALAAHPAVLEAAVVPQEDADRLLKPKAYIVLREGSQASAALEQALKDHVKAAVGMWKYPRWIEVVDSLPRTATGKIQRFKLREGQ
jgi:4-hydroxybenzoate-CoA ligase